MTARPLPITALSLATGLGRTAATTYDAMLRGETGLVPTTGELDLPFDTFYAQIPGTFAPLPSRWSHRETHQARITQHALLELDGAADRAVARWGAHRVGVVIGSTTGGIGDTEQHHHAVGPDGLHTDGYDIERQHNIHATAELLARLIGATGPTFAQSSACSSSAKVLATARRLIEADICDAVLTGGIDSRCRFTLLGFHGLGILSPEPCLPLSANRRGINLGEAAALLLVEREGEGRALLRAVGETSDAHHLTQPRPDGGGLEAAIQHALASAGLTPDDIDLVNAHATGTPLNDAAECTAIGRALPHRPPVIATKGYTGHTLGAAGAVEAVLTVLALERGSSPGTRTQAPLLPEGEGLHLPLEPVRASFRVALSTSAAFAGHNAAVLLERP